MHRPRKRFGQNFLRDQHVLDRIIAAADFQEDDRILEIGPGPGALTSRLLASGLPVLAVEIDRDLGAELQARDEKNLEVIIGDVLRLDWAEMLQSPPYILVANLPYNISSQILFKVLDHRHAFRRLVLMFQKEVGDRLVAGEGTRSSVRFSSPGFRSPGLSRSPPGRSIHRPRLILSSSALSLCRSHA